MKQTYLIELLNNSQIDEANSLLDKRAKIYYPLVGIFYDESNKNKNTRQIFKQEIKDSLISERMDNILQHPKLMLPKNCRIIPNNWLGLVVVNETANAVDGDGGSGTGDDVGAAEKEVTCVKNAKGDVFCYETLPTIEHCLKPMVEEDPPLCIKGN